MAEPREPEEPETRPEDFEDEPEKFEPHKMMAASLGSVAAATVMSRFGLAGTLIGAALAPMLVMLSVYALAPRIRRGIKRGRSAVTRSFEPVVVRPGHDWRWAFRHPIGLLQRIRGLTRRQFALATAGAAIAFLLSLVAITAFEAVVGKPLSAVGREGGAARGTTLAPRDEPQRLRVPDAPNEEAKPLPTEKETPTVRTEPTPPEPSRSETEPSRTETVTVTIPPEPDSE